MSLSKKMISSVLAFSIISISSTNMFTQSSFAQEAQPQIAQYHLENNVVDENFVVVGIKYTDTTVEVKETKQGKETNLVEKETYIFKENKEKYAEMFPDHTTTTEILITNENEYFINDKKLSEEELNTPYSSDVTNDLSMKGTAMGVMTLGLESGGKQGLTYYTNRGLKPYDVYDFRAYPSANFFLEKAEGSVTFGSASASTHGSRLSDFKMYANVVASSKDGVDQGMVQLAASGVGYFAHVIIGMIGTSVAAYQVYKNSNAGLEAMRNAYNVIK
ncbi:hypothetical protein [Saccharibacillus brassicae]|uniref:Uncharacterized protein n=1 Tax=Saccharibacillus brassicae TaxID=2583377 RepID=A0A4Y6UTU0_SACBS|nr:hypothetical protein [Saccharibacillus brassicae]QDH21133.1 hypothetical protein FFV09_09875 [Saccharibacillus brassicae]